MQIQNVEALKSWLTSRLEPICDADPAALAKYVVALVKKDKAPEELKHVCIDQLEVFLSDETNKFVEVLFESLESQSYLPPAIVEPIPPKTTEKIRKPSISDDLNTSKSLADSSVPDDDERDFRRTRKITENSNSSDSKETQVIGDKGRKRKAEDEGSRLDQAKVPKEEQIGLMLKKPDSDDSEGKRNGGSQAIPVSQPSRDSGARERRYQTRRDFNSRNEDDDRFRRSGGPSWNHRERGPARERDERPGRMRDYRERERFHDGNQRFGHRDRGGKNRCRDYEEKGFCIMGELCPYDHGNDPVVIQDMPMQGMIPGFPPPATFIPAGPPPLGGLPVPPRILPVPPERFQGPQNQPPPPGTILKNPEPTESPKTQKGDQPKPVSSPPESGSVPGLPVSSILQPMVRPPPPVIVMPNIERPPFVPPMHGPRLPGPTFPQPEDSYNPEQPQFERLPVWMRIGTSGSSMPAAPYNPDLAIRSRELVNVPPNQSQLTVQVMTNKPTGESNRVVIGPDTVKQELDQKKTNDIKQKPAWRKLNDTIELKKVPREINNITRLNDYFQKFGNIINIQVNAFGDSEAALIKFSNPSEAKSAYTCPDAVLGNRFIRVFWHQPDRENNQSSNKGSKQASTETNKIPVKPTMFQSGKTTFVRQPKPVTTETGTASTSTTSSTSVATSTIVTATITKSKDIRPVTTTPVVSTALTSISTGVVSTTIAPKTTVPLSKHQQRQDILRKRLEIQKQKQQLLDKQIQQQKLLISKLEKKNLTASEKEDVMKTLKSLSKNIESIRKEIELATMTAKSKQSPLQARELAKKAILDQELDLITHQHSGEDTTELKKKVEELKQEAKSLGLFDVSGKERGYTSLRGRGMNYPRRGRGRGRGRDIQNTRVWTKESAALDMNSKQLCVTNIKPSEKEAIIEHFMEFGNVDRVEYEEEKSNLTLTFRTRKEAEIAFKAKKLKDRVLELSWKRMPPLPTPSVPPPSTTSIAPAVSVSTVSTPTLRSRSSTLSSSKLDDVELVLDLEGELEKHEMEHDEEDEALLLGDDLDEEEEEEEDRSWRR